MILLINLPSIINLFLFVFFKPVQHSLPPFFHFYLQIWNILLSMTSCGIIICIKWQCFFPPCNSSTTYFCLTFYPMSCISCIIIKYQFISHKNDGRKADADIQEYNYHSFNCDLYNMMFPTKFSLVKVLVQKWCNFILLKKSHKSILLMSFDNLRSWDWRITELTVSNVRKMIV